MNINFSTGHGSYRMHPFRVLPRPLRLLSQRARCPEVVPHHGVSRAVPLFIGAIVVLAAGPARATPRPLPFSYPYETLPQGGLEVEQYVDLVPMRVVREGDAGSDAVTSVRSNLETEIEYGITDHVEASWYFVFRQGASASTPAMRFMGVKQRVRFRFGETEDLPVDMGLYLEVAEFYDELEFEQKLLLSKRLGPVTLVSNLWVEQEYYFQDQEWRYLYNPTLGASYQVMPSLFLGLEYWIRGSFEAGEESTDDDDGDDAGPVHYAGPTAMVQSENGFASLGAYLRWDELGQGAKPDDPWGKVWVRVLFGVDL